MQGSSNHVKSETWNRHQLRSLGLITLSWQRRDIPNPRIFTSTFHVSTDDSFKLLLGNELLSEEPEIENPKNATLIGVISKATQGKYFVALSIYTFLFCITERANSSLAYAFHLLEQRDAATANRQRQEQRVRESEALLEEDAREQQVHDSQYTQQGPSASTSNTQPGSSTRTGNNQPGSSTLASGSRR